MPSPSGGPQPLFPGLRPLQMCAHQCARVSGCGCVLVVSGLSRSSKCAWPGTRACSCSGSAPAGGVRLVEPSVRNRACGRRRRRRRRRGERGGGRLGARRKDASRELFGRSGSMSCRARRGSPPAAGQEASACARRHPSPTSASRLFLVPGSRGPCVPGETQRRSPTPAGAVCSHAPAAVSPERTD